jgi:uncharacterized protein (TIGR00369 family)
MIVDPETLKTIPNWEDQACFACGARNPHGLQMKFSTDGRRVYSLLHVPERMAGWDQTIHGGILSTILDEIMGWSVIYLLKMLGFTKTMTVNYHRAVTAGERITIVGGVQEPPVKRSARMMGEIYNAQDELCADATGEFTVMAPKLAVRMKLVGKDYMKTFGPILNFDYDG